VVLFYGDYGEFTALGSMATWGFIIEYGVDNAGLVGAIDATSATAQSVEIDIAKYASFLAPFGELPFLELALMNEDDYADNPPGSGAKINVLQMIGSAQEGGPYLEITMPASFFGHHAVGRGVGNGVHMGVG